MFTLSQTHNTYSSNHLVRSQLPFVSKMTKRLTPCIRWDAEREHSILPSVTYTLDIYQVSYFVGFCFKMGVFLCPAWSEKSVNGISRVFSYLTKCAIYRTWAHTLQCRLWLLARSQLRAQQPRAQHASLVGRRPAAVTAALSIFSSRKLDSSTGPHPATLMVFNG